APRSPSRSRSSRLPARWSVVGRGDLEGEGQGSGDRGAVGDAATEEAVAVVGKGGGEGAVPAPVVPGSDVAEDAVDVEGLVRAVGTDVRDLDGAAAEFACDECRDAVEGAGEQEAAPG